TAAMRMPMPARARLTALTALAAALMLAPPGRPAGEAAPRAAERAEMVETIAAHAERAPGAVEGGGIDPEVMQVMRAVPRHLFVPEGEQAAAYADRPLPIGSGQTISQPFIVALMTDLLDLEPGDKVLEIGTGSGYQAAVLSPLADEVFTIEIVPELGRRAAAALNEGGFDNVQTKLGDGYYGWPEEAPFDGIVVTAAAGSIPPPLVQQLEVGGRMVIPVGGPFSAQQLMLVEKQDEGSFTTRQLLPVRFVPFTRAE
ncbi:MAG TPA: protein-L-isoaspartate(D-aspartate) O-methyltransferase, partial [Thermohalobaculum sp.]|nr:protein-L-isoaspartate(D-aspartate) O-methyltransferase [Thermohalobaculum sp.]